MFGDVCNGNSTCEEGALQCGERMKEAFMEKAKRERNVHRENMKQCIEQVDIEFPEWGEGGKDREGGRRHGGGRGKDGFNHREFWTSIDENKLKELKKCIMEKNGFIDGSGRINRDNILSDIRESFSDQSNLLSSMVSAIDTCPEPQELKMWEFFKCLGNTCIKNITI